MKKLFFLLCCWFYLLLKMWLDLPDGRFHIYFLDIGQGDSVLIQTPEAYFVLIDGGPGNTVLEELAETMPFLLKKIDLLVLSHPHADHMEGLIEVLKRYDFDYVLISGVLSVNDYYAEFLRSAGDKILIAEADLDLKLGDLILDTLYPIRSMGGMKIDNLNNASVALKAIYGDRSALFSGDLEVEGENELAASGQDLSADILKAGHHGSDTSSTMPFLELVKAKIAVIQCGVDNDYGHPKPGALFNLKRSGVQKILRNDLSGRVEIVF